MSRFSGLVSALFVAVGVGVGFGSGWALEAGAQDKSDVEAVVISQRVWDRIPGVKRSVIVHLSAEMPEDSLVALGKRIRAQDPGYERTFIEYYLPGMKEGSGAWAVTHWTPEPEVRILGNVQRFDQMTEAEARAAHAAEQLAVPGVVALLEQPDFQARYEAGWAAVSCSGYKGTDALYGDFRNLAGSERAAWNGATIVLDDKYQAAEEAGEDFDCSVVGKYLEKGWLVKRAE